MYALGLLACMGVAGAAGLSFLVGVARAAWTLGALALALAPLMIGMVLLAPRMDRERAKLEARGYHERDAVKRLGKNGLWAYGPLLVGTAVWAAALWFVSSLLALGPGLGGRTAPLSGTLAFQLLLFGVLACWQALWFGRVDGEGRHCARCGHPVAERQIPICTECGRVFAFGIDIEDGYRHRPGWMWTLAIASTLALAGAFVARLSFATSLGMVRITPTGSLIRAATGGDYSGARSAWSEIATRTLSPVERAKLVDATLAAWERDVSATLIDSSRTFLRDELDAGSMSDEQAERLMAMISGAPTNSGVQSMWVELVKTPLPERFPDGFLDLWIRFVAEDPQLTFIGTPQAVDAAASGDLEPATFERLREALKGKPGSADEYWRQSFYSSLIPRLEGEPEQSMLLDDMIERVLNAPQDGMPFSAAQVRTAARSGWLNRAQLERLARVPRPVDGTVRFDLWDWILLERNAERFDPELAQMVDEIQKQFRRSSP